MVTKKIEAIIYTRLKAMLIDREVVWSTSAKMLDIEAKILALTWQRPKKVGVKMVGLKTMKSI